MTDPATEYAAATHRVRQALLAAEARKHPTETGIDDDPRDPDQQADDFFTRPGDFHQLDIDIPIEDWAGVNGTSSAQCVIKFTPDQKHLIVEVLRQIRGALAARITLTPAQPTDDCTITANTWLPGDPAPPPAKGCPNQGSTCNCTGACHPTAHEIRAAAEQLADTCTSSANPWGGATCCPINGQPCHCDRTPNSCPYTSNRLTPIPMTNGKTAHAITPPPRPTSGRHAKPEGEQA